MILLIIFSEKFIEYLIRFKKVIQNFYQSTNTYNLNFKR